MTRTPLGPLFDARRLVAARGRHASQTAGAAAGLPRAGSQARWIVRTLIALGPKTREELLGLAPRRLHLTEAKMCARLWRLEGNAPKGTPAWRNPPALVRKAGKRRSTASGRKVDVHVYAATDLARELLQHEGT